MDEPLPVATINQRLALLSKHYSALSPSVPSLIPSPDPFPSPVELSHPSTQRWIVNHLLPLDELEDDDDQDDDELEEADEEDVRERPTRAVKTTSSSGLNWKRGFWKRVVKGIEQGYEDRKRQFGADSIEDEEVQAEILERMVDYMSLGGSLTGTSSAGLSRRTYYWGDLESPREQWNSIKTSEEGRLISGGTTGLRTWQACIALANHFMLDPGTIEKSDSIVELGAGVGLLSLVVARLKQWQKEQEAGSKRRRIVATDVDEKVLELLEKNVKLNELEGQVKTMNLDWELATFDTRDSELEFTNWENEAFGTSHLDGVDLIIGADIVYDPSLTGLLAATIARLLRGNINTLPDDGMARKLQKTRGEAIIAGTIRNESTWETFLQACRLRHLEIEEIELRTFKDGSGLVGAEGWEGEGVVRVVRLTLS